MPAARGRLASPIRWAGSKRQLIGTLSKLWRSTDARYIEPFSGSAGLFFNLRPNDALLNDTNADLILAFRTLAKSPILLHNALMEIGRSADAYYALRAQHKLSDPFERAVRFLYLNRFCFNGIYRTNLLGEFNVPHASYGTGNFPALEEWIQASNALKQARLTCMDFDEAVRGHLINGSFVFLDPPYSVHSRRVFSEYSSTQFGISDLGRLRRLMRHIDECGAIFVVTFEASEETETLKDGWAYIELAARRSVAGFAGHRRSASEVLITNRPERLKDAGLI